MRKGGEWSEGVKVTERERQRDREREREVKTNSIILQYGKSYSIKKLFRSKNYFSQKDEIRVATFLFV